MKASYLAKIIIPLAVCIFQVYGGEGQNAPQTDLKKQISKIDSMTKVNQEPSLMLPFMLADCRMPAVDLKNLEEHQKDENPHKEYYINVYVNDIGKNAMLEMKAPDFPIGSVIIKEKFPISSIVDTLDQEKEVELYTVMIKRKEGFNPECGDWEFGAINGDLDQSEVGKLTRCISCHKKNPQMDYIFRDYYYTRDFKE